MSPTLRSVEDRLAPYALYIGAVSGMIAMLALMIGEAVVPAQENDLMEYLKGI